MGEGVMWDGSGAMGEKESGAELVWRYVGL
jgi:hypothetical protein